MCGTGASLPTCIFNIRRARARPPRSFFTHCLFHHQEYMPEPGMAQSQDVCERCLSGEPYDGHSHHHRAAQPSSDADMMSEEEPLTLDSQATIPCGQPHSAVRRRQNRKAAALNIGSSQPSADAVTPSHRRTAAAASEDEVWVYRRVANGCVSFNALSGSDTIIISNARRG